MLTALGGEKPVYRPLVFYKLTALGTLSIHGHKVYWRLVHFVGLVFALALAAPAPGMPLGSTLAA